MFLTLKVLKAEKSSHLHPVYTQFIETNDSFCLSKGVTSSQTIEMCQTYAGDLWLDRQSQINIWVITKHY